MRAHYFYRWCTMGGVERTLINRALVLRQRGSDFRITITFLDATPALELFDRALRHYGLENHIFVTDGPPEDSQLIVTIDTPEAFRYRCPKLPFLVECHTTYEKNQHYLAALPDWVRAIIVPSEELAKDLVAKRLVQQEPIVIPNILPRWTVEMQGIKGNVWTQRPLTYIGRLDDWKNTAELLQIWSQLRRCRHDVFFILAGPQTGEPEIAAALQQAGILDVTVRLPSVPFESIPRLLGLVRQHRGMVVSASKGESFGWLPAEAIVAGVPVLLSDNAGHKHIVADDRDFLYELGTPTLGTTAAFATLDNWEERAAKLSSLSLRLTDEERLCRAWNWLSEKVF